MTEKDELEKLREASAEYSQNNCLLTELRSRWNWESYQNSIHHLVERQKELEKFINDYFDRMFEEKR